MTRDTHLGTIAGLRGRAYIVRSGLFVSITGGVRVVVIGREWYLFV